LNKARAAKVAQNTVGHGNASHVLPMPLFCLCNAHEAVGIPMNLLSLFRWLEVGYEGIFNTMFHAV
jgi:hypothetical protein